MYSVVRNFGGNVEFHPQQIIAPASETEILELLSRHPRRVRVVGSRHAWSPLIQTDDVLLDLRRLSSVQVVSSTDGTVHVRAQGGCPIWKVLEALNEHGLTLPAVGLITAQTIAGAISTGTHGSGRSSISHYVQQLRLACYDESGEVPRIVTISGGDELRAARCALGLMGIILEVTFTAVPQYHVQEVLTPVNSLEQALESESGWPLQQLYLMPHLWRYYVQRRRQVAPGNRFLADIYRIYWFVAMDLGLHLLVLGALQLAQRRRLIKVLFRWLLPWFVFSWWKATDRSDRQLTMSHDLFRHVEEELYVRRDQLRDALEVVREVLRLTDDRMHLLDPGVRSRLSDAGLLSQLERLAGTWTHHYPICIRRVAPDDTLISVTAGSTQDWYSISLISYMRPTDEFLAVSGFLARALGKLCDARPHWGKWFPWQESDAIPQYPGLHDFRRIVARYDRKGVFRNDLVDRILGGES
jgi:FAD/FMN-containing dehydrogenase